MTKNKKLQRAKVFGLSAMPNAGTEMRNKHMKHIQYWIESFLGLPNGVTSGKLNAKSKLLLKPNWENNTLDYEPNPDAAVHEIGHLFLAPLGVSLEAYDSEMREQFGHVIQTYGFMKQKRSLFEVLPMAMEQKIRRLLGMPPSDKHIKLKSRFDRPRTCLETNEVITNRVRRGDKWIDLIRCASLLDAGCLERLEMILSGEILFDSTSGWYYNNSIDAKINRRARLKSKNNSEVKRCETFKKKLA